MMEQTVIEITDRFESTAVESAYIVVDRAPGIGGCRILDYSERTLDPLDDARNLALAMTRKTGAVGVDLAGAKAVIDVHGDVEDVKTPEMLRTFGRAVDDLDGKYTTAEDMGTTTADMDVVAEVTDHVVGLSESQGGLGDPSPVTAYGVIHGMQASLEHRRGDGTLEDTTVLVQGAGKVGRPLIAGLIERGARVKVAEIDDTNVAKLRDTLPEDVPHPAFERVAADAALTEGCDVFAPCAVSGVVGPDDVDALNCDILAGSANDVLVDEQRCAERLAAADVLYAPDFVINAGGLLAVLEERRDGGNLERARERAAKIGPRLQEIFETADRESITTLEAARRIAERRVKA